MLTLWHQQLEVAFAIEFYIHTSEEIYNFLYIWLAGNPLHSLYML